MLLQSIFMLMTSFLLALFSIKKIIYISKKKNLFDEPSEFRKVHGARTPNLGGIAIFGSFFFTGLAFQVEISRSNYLLIAAIIIFILGMIDDLVGTSPRYKIGAQLTAALLTTTTTTYRFTNFHGIFGIYEIPYAVSILISVVFILLVINAFNLIDGVNCLAGGIGLFACLTFAFCFWKLGDSIFMMLAATMCGCLTGFLFYNRTPAKIFMGDTGSLMLGFTIAIFSIRFLELTKIEEAGELTGIFKSAPAILFAILIIPLFDTVRVFFLRILKRKSPFLADKNHIHHRFLSLNFTHLQTTGILLLVNICVVSFAILFQNINDNILFLLITLFILTVNRTLSFFIYKTKKSIGSKDLYSQKGLAGS